MSTILVTGGCGFIGSHTSSLLIKNGYNIVILDSNINSDLSTSNKIIKLTKDNNIRGSLKVFKCDIRDENRLDEIFKINQNCNKPIIAVIHFAGLKSVYESNINPLDYWDVNVLGTINLLKVMSRNKCFTMVFSSSATVYGNSNLSPIKENGSIKPINTYGKTKSTIENILLDIQIQLGLIHQDY